MVTKSFVIFVFCLISSISAFSPNWKLTPPDAAFQMDYSSDQKYIAIVNSSDVVIYEAEFGKKIQDLSLERQGLQSFAFNADSTWLAVGFNDGEARLYNQDQGQFVFTNKTYKHATTTPAVKSVCFASDSSNVVLGLYDDEVVVWKVSDGTTISTDFSNEYVQTVSCSPINPTLFVVGGGLNTKSKYTFYTHDDTSISVVNDASGAMAQSAMASVFSSDGLHAYRTERNGNIYRYDTTLFTEEKLDLPTLAGNSLTKIRVSNDYMLIAVAFTDKAVIITNSTSANAFTVQQFASSISSVALSPNGGHFLYVTATGEAQVSGQCPNGKYLSAGACVDCNAGCSYCDLSPDTCFSCTPKYFLNNNQCLKCGTGCQDCTNASTCVTCDTVGHFTKNIANLCVCDTSYFLRQEQCLACGAGCTQCVDQVQCTTCKPEFENLDGLCKCKAGTYFSVDTCLNCVRGCQKCQNGTVCQSCSVVNHYKIENDVCICDVLDHVQDDGTNCLCAQGYYNQQNVCLLCPLGCKTCQSTTVCDDCVSAQFAVRDDMCKCVDTASYISFNLTCQKCQTELTFCIQCTDAYTCTSCQAGIHRSINDGKCLCDSGYYPDTSQVCQTCSIIAGCLTCSSQTNCLTCNTVQNWQNDPTNNLCRCKKHFSQDNGTCYQCGVGCAKCDKTQCLQCDQTQHWVTDGTGCKCDVAYYLETDQCLQCQAGCIQCLNGNSCQTCDQVNHFSKNNGTCECVVGYYLDERTCYTCSHNIAYCKQCSVDGKICNSCVGQLLLKNNECGCQKGSWINQQVCSKCPEGCSDCDNNDSCTACQEDYDLDNGVCKKSGLDTLIIVLIIVGVIVLAGAVFVVVKCIKKRRLPANDDYEEL